MTENTYQDIEDIATNLLQDANTKYRNIIESKRWGPMISTRKFNEPTLPKLYADDINIIVNDSLKQGGFSHI